MATIVIGQIPERVVRGHRLGRNYRYDSRSQRYLYQVPVTAINSVTWPRHIPVLDQGDIGSCTGNAMVGAIGTGPVFDALPGDHVPLDEALAVKLYSRATVIDDAEGFTGQYPPDDTGSDGLSVSKAAVEGHFISGYQHALDVPMMLTALQAGPVIVGVNWYSSFDNPDATGLVKIGSSAFVRGGHEFLVRGVDVARQVFSADNSWGSGWGNQGSFRFSYAVMERLLSEQGDCTVPVPLSDPAPVPTPVPPEPPAADPRDAQMWQAVKPWAQARHVGSNRKAATEVRSWAHDKGLYE